MTDPYDLLAIAPHPDDVEIFCGGTVAKAVQQGHRVQILDLTRGELASRGTVEERAEEAARAAQILGIDRANLGLPDGHIRDDDDATRRLAAHLRATRPRVVLAPYERARHPDHRAASTLVDRAVFFSRLRNADVDGEPHHVSRVLYYLQRHVTTPDFLVDISDTWNTKCDAISAHGSQVIADPNAPRTLVGSPDALAAIQTRDQYWGTQLGVPFAEGFMCRNAVPIDDIVAHFGDLKEPHFSPDIA